MRAEKSRQVVIVVLHVPARIRETTNAVESLIAENDVVPLMNRSWNPTVGCVAEHRLSQGDRFEKHRRHSWRRLQRHDCDIQQAPHRCIWVLKAIWQEC